MSPHGGGCGGGCGGGGCGDGGGVDGTTIGPNVPPCPNAICVTNGKVLFGFSIFWLALFIGGIELVIKAPRTCPSGCSYNKCYSSVANGTSSTLDCSCYDGTCANDHYTEAGEYKVYFGFVSIFAGVICGIICCRFHHDYLYMQAIARALDEEDFSSDSDPEIEFPEVILPSADPLYSTECMSVQPSAPPALFPVVYMCPAVPYPLILPDQVVYSHGEFILDSKI